MSGFTHAVNTGTAYPGPPDLGAASCKGKTLARLKTAKPEAGIIGSDPE